MTLEFHIEIVFQSIKFKKKNYSVRKPRGRGLLLKWPALGQISPIFTGQISRANQRDKEGHKGQWGTGLSHDSVVFSAVLRIRIEKMRMRMRIQEKISMRMRMRIRMLIHALTELWRPKYWYKKFLKGQSSEIWVPFLTYMERPRPDFQEFWKILKPEAVLIEA